MCYSDSHGLQIAADRALLDHLGLGHAANSAGGLLDHDRLRWILSDTISEQNPLDVLD